MVESTAVFSLNPVVAIEDFHQSSLALHCEELRLVELNVTARDIVGRLDGQRTLAEVADAMAADYDQPVDMVLSDVIEVIEQMVALDVVQLAAFS